MTKERDKTKVEIDVLGLPLAGICTYEEACRPPHGIDPGDIPLLQMRHPLKVRFAFQK
ncbi:hypothetical protein I8J29_22745 [Paenibacillus sp. MWE-103]|uniref:Uncharacterized protein n=1 Tax=Paenibacillus artemisiicola TaxID=1172618 RepID=A0ABS3WFY9_9BACL|nr:hypothetical protein [Paenibacillus artemisiicola]MBO7747026.1 hypothetical protein [Paenibacillus artemisiicola]